MEGWRIVFSRHYQPRLRPSRRCTRGPISRPISPIPTVIQILLFLHKTIAQRLVVTVVGRKTRHNSTFRRMANPNPSQRSSHAPGSTYLHSQIPPVFHRRPLRARLDRHPSRHHRLLPPSGHLFPRKSLNRQEKETHYHCRFRLAPSRHRGAPISRHPSHHRAICRLLHPSCWLRPRPAPIRSAQPKRTGPPALNGRRRRRKSRRIGYGLIVPVPAPDFTTHRHPESMTDRVRVLGCTTTRFRVKPSPR